MQINKIWRTSSPPELTAIMNSQTAVNICFPTCIEINQWCIHSIKIPVRAWTCSWCPSLCWGGCGAVSLQEEGWGIFLCRVEKKLYSFREDQGRLTALLAGEQEEQTLRNSPYFFFLKKMMAFPIFWVMKKNTVEFWTCNLEFIFSIPRQCMCRTIGYLWMPCFRPTTWRTWSSVQSNLISFAAMRFQLIDMQVINN